MITRITPIEVVNGGVVCPNLYTVEFTCVGVEVSFLEWQRNRMRIDIFTTNSNEGEVLQPEGPLRVVLDSITRRGGRANMTSRLIGNISNQLDSEDIISCIETHPEIEATATLQYTLIGKSCSYILYALQMTFLTHFPQNSHLWCQQTFQ